MVHLQMGQPALFGLAAALLKMSTIIDSSGTLISGALVKITQTVTGQERQTVTASDGSYVLPNLPIGPHKLEVNARPFRRYVPSRMHSRNSISRPMEYRPRTGCIITQRLTQ
jgi:hypothetical protein